MRGDLDLVVAELWYALEHGDSDGRAARLRGLYPEARQVRIRVPRLCAYQLTLDDALVRRAGEQLGLGFESSESEAA